MPASQAFDAMRQQKVQAERIRAAQAAQSGEEKAEAPAQEKAYPPGFFDGVGRNDLCPCGSGLKFKKCHGKAEA